MMNKKGLLVVLREIFAFTFGILILITITSMYNTVITPNIRLYSYNEQLLGIVEHINSILTRVDNCIKDGINTTFIVKEDMPSKVGTSPYRVYIQDSQICAKTTGDIIVTRCISYTTSSMVTGGYFGGTALYVEGHNDPSSGLTITFKNYL